MLAPVAAVLPFTTDAPIEDRALLAPSAAADATPGTPLTVCEMWTDCVR